MAKPAPRMGRPAAVPSLVFADLDEAVGYYRDIFGSDARWDQDGGTEAFVHVHGATIRLRQALPGELDGLPTGCTNDLEDVLVLVDRPYQLYRHLDDRGADGLDGAEPGAGGVFRIVDPAGHVLGLAPTRGVLPAVRRLAWPPAADRLQIALRHRRTAREEAPQLRKLAEFYRALPNKRDIFYMFFSSGLLNWVAKSTSYLPDDLNLVLIGSDLPADEQQWVRDHLRWPFVHLDLRIDDNTAWDFLYEVNEHSFGWLDTDCLVLNDGLFGELAEIADTDVVNAVWWHDTGSGFPLGNTYFMFVNIAAVRAVRDAGLGAKGGMYSYHAFNRHVPGRACYSHVVGRRLRKQLLTVLVPDEYGRPSFPGPGMTLFDTTHLHQAVAHSLGFGFGQTRRLQRRGDGVTGPVFEEVSDEVVHIGGVSYAGAMTDFSSLFHEPATRIRYLLADHITLRETASRLPEAYGRRHERVLAALAELGLDADAALAAARMHLTEERGLSEPAVDRLLQPSIPARA